MLILSAQIRLHWQDHRPSKSLLRLGTCGSTILGQPLIPFNQLQPFVATIRVLVAH